MNRRKPAHGQSGAAMVEFAVVAVVFLTLLLGIMDFGRILFTWNAAAEATRWGARIAVVCDKATPDQIRGQMRKILPQLTNDNIEINYYDPPGVISTTCTKSNCKAVEVRISRINPLDIPAISPFTGFLTLAMPPFRTYLPRESMEATNDDGDDNPVCFL
ncbi:MAG: TadE/TadG family type IV pilus assembly protein [Gammaproteobacteria bacterium]